MIKETSEQQPQPSPEEDEKIRKELKEKWGFYIGEKVKVRRTRKKGEKEGKIEEDWEVFSLPIEGGVMEDTVQVVKGDPTGKHLSKIIKLEELRALNREGPPEEIIKPEKLEKETTQEDVEQEAAKTEKAVDRNVEEVRDAGEKAPEEVKESEFEQARERLIQAKADMKKITGVRGFLAFEKEAKTEESREAVKEEYEEALEDYEAKKEELLKDVTKERLKDMDKRKQELLKDVDKEKESFDKESALTPEQEQEAVPKEKEKLADINKQAEDTTQKAKELLAGELKYLDIEPKEIFKRLSDKEIQTLYELMRKKDNEKIVAFYKEKIQEVAVSQGKEDLLIKGKAEEIAQNIHQVIHQTIEAEAQEAVSKLGWKKAGKMVGGILKNFALIGGAAYLIGAAGIATGGAGVVVMAGGLALTRLITKKIENKVKQKKATKTEEKFQKQLEQARNKAQEDLFEDIEKLKRELSGTISNEMRRQTSEEAITTLKEYKKAKVEGKDEVLESKLQDLEKEFYLNALTKVKAEYPDVDEEQQKNMAVQMAMTLAQHERGEHEAKKRLETLKNEKPKVYELVQKFNLLRSGTPDKKPEGMTEEEKGIWEKYKYDIISLATGTAIGVAIRTSSLGRVVAGAIGGVGIGYVLGEAGGKKAEIKGIKEIELMIDEAEKVIKDIEFPAKELPQLRENSTLVQSRLELGLLDSNPLLKSRAENFIHNVRQVEFANQKVLNELLRQQEANTQKLEEKIEQDVSRIEKKTKRRKLISMVGGGLGGALTAGYFTKEGKEILGIGGEAAPDEVVAEGITPEVPTETAAESDGVTPEALAKVAPEVVPEHLDYQDGDSVWKEIENQMDDRCAFKEWYASADEAERTYAIDYIKDKVVEDPQEYFSEDYLPTDVDKVTSEQLENLNWDKLFCEASSAEELNEVIPVLTEEAKQSIIENNELLAEYVSKTNEAIDSSTVDQLLTDIKDAGDVDQYLQSLEAAEVVPAELGEEYWEDLTDKMNEALAAGDEDQIKALVLEAVQKEPDWALDQNQTQFFLRVLEGNDGVIGKDFGGLVAEGNEFNKDTLDLAVEFFKEKAASGKLPDSDMWTPRYIDEARQEQLVNMRKIGLFKYEVDYTGEGSENSGIVRGFTPRGVFEKAQQFVQDAQTAPLEEAAIAAQEAESAAPPPVEEAEKVVSVAAEEEIKPTVDAVEEPAPKPVEEVEKDIEAAAAIEPETEAPTIEESVPVEEPALAEESIAEEKVVEEPLEGEKPAETVQTPEMSIQELLGGEEDFPDGVSVNVDEQTAKIMADQGIYFEDGKLHIGEGTLHFTAETAEPGIDVKDTGITESVDIQMKGDNLEILVKDTDGSIDKLVVGPDNKLIATEGVEAFSEQAKAVLEQTEKTIEPGSAPIEEAIEEPVDQTPTEFEAAAVSPEAVPDAAEQVAEEAAAEPETPPVTEAAPLTETEPVDTTESSLEQTTSVDTGEVASVEGEFVMPTSRQEIINRVKQMVQENGVLKPDGSPSDSAFDSMNPEDLPEKGDITIGRQKFDLSNPEDRVKVADINKGRALMQADEALGKQMYEHELNMKITELGHEPDAFEEIDLNNAMSEDGWTEYAPASEQPIAQQE